MIKLGHYHYIDENLLDFLEEAMVTTNQAETIDLSNLPNIESKVKALIEHYGLEEIASACTPIIYQKFTSDDAEQRFTELEWFFRVEADIGYNLYPELGGKEFAMEIYGQDLSTFMGVSKQETPAGIDLTEPNKALNLIFGFLSTFDQELACMWRWNVDLSLAVFHTIDCAGLAHPDSSSKEAFLNENFPEWKTYKQQIEDSAHMLVKQYPRVVAELVAKINASSAQ